VLLVKRDQKIITTTNGREAQGVVAKSMHELSKTNATKMIHAGPDLDRWMEEKSHRALMSETYNKRLQTESESLETALGFNT
jgi:hypothetical protein